MLMQPLIWLLGPIGFQEILVVLLILLVLFGGRKIPELARGLGRGITEFKHGIRDEPETQKEKLPGEGASADKRDERGEGGETKTNKTQKADKT